MKKLIILLFIALCTVQGVYAGIDHLLPQPQKIVKRKGVFNLNRTIQLILPPTTSGDPSIKSELGGFIGMNGGNVTEKPSKAVIRIKLTDKVDGCEFQEEAYSLNIEPSQLTIQATTLQGAYWAVQTLHQLAEGNKGKIPACTITDWPAFPIRGYMHDIGRSYMNYDEIKKHIVNLSRYKVNVFHWHLTENQGWRLESKRFPQLNAPSSYTRHPGKYYTIEQAKELVAFAKQHNIIVIPEIDMPGHSEAFTRAFGYSMQTPKGLETLKELMNEICDVFKDSEWMHIGTDEVKITMPNFVPDMVSHIRSKGKKVISWNPGYKYTSDGIDMIMMWSNHGRPLPGKPAIDLRFHYINHFDTFSDLVGIYNSNIARQPKRNEQYAGVIVGMWNDRIMENDNALLTQNNFYPALLAVAERAWKGGGDKYIQENGVQLNPSQSDFPDFERRLLFHKNNYLKNEPIAYVKQVDASWKVTDAFPNSGNLTASFPPENQLSDTYSYEGKSYNTRTVYGSGICLRHVWDPVVSGLFKNPQPNSTAYAYTYIYSPKAQKVGAWIEFQNYSRSEPDLAPRQGKWDNKESRIWINDAEIAPPVWENTHTVRNQEIPLKNENMVARAPIPVELKKGWNTVFVKLPVGAFTTPEVRLIRWGFAFAFVTPDGKDAIEGLIYSPEMRK